MSPRREEIALRVPPDILAGYLHELIAQAKNLPPVGVGPQPSASRRLRQDFLAWMRQVEDVLVRSVDEPIVALNLQTPRYVAILGDQIADDSLFRSIDAELVLVAGQLERLLRSLNAPPEVSTDQADRIRAWANLEMMPPRLVVVNASDGPVRFLVPTIYLTAQPQQALVGGEQQALAELSPGYSFIWRLDHFATWAREPQVTSHLTVDFDDERGRRWRLAHGGVTPIDHVDPVTLQFLQGAAIPASSVDFDRDPSEQLGDEAERVVFVSYVHEDAALVDRLEADLTVAGLTVWRDSNDLLPGDDLKSLIRRTIESHAFAFVACFSDNYLSRDSTYMNEELSIALEEVRRRGNASWFFPVRLTDCELPDLEFGLGRRMRDIVWTNLWRDWDSESRRLVRGIHGRV